MNDKTKCKVRSKFNHQWLNTAYSNRTWTFTGSNSTNQCKSLDTFTNEFKSLFGSTALENGLVYTCHFECDISFATGTDTSGIILLQLYNYPYSWVTSQTSIESLKNTSHVSTNFSIAKSSSGESGLNGIQCRLDSVPSTTTVTIKNWRLGITLVTKGDDPRSHEFGIVKGGGSSD